MNEGTRSEAPGVQTEDSPLLVNDANPHTYATGEAPLDSAQRSLLWYIWRLSVILAVVFLLALFVKGWLDADQDFKVSR